MDDGSNELINKAYESTFFVEMKTSRLGVTVAEQHPIISFAPPVVYFHLSAGDSMCTRGRV